MANFCYCLFRLKGYFIVVLLCIFPMNSNVSHLFMCFLSFKYFLWGSFYLDHLSTFKLLAHLIELQVFFIYSVYTSGYVIYNYCLPNCGLSLHFLNGTCSKKVQIIFFSYESRLWYVSKNSLPNPRSKIFFHILFIFIVLTITTRSIIHF